MDRELIAEKIDRSDAACTRKKKRHSSAAVLREDRDAQDIIALNLTRAVQLCVDVAAHILAERDEPVPDTMSASFERLQQAGVISKPLATRMQGAVGFRNIVIHAYRDVDWDIVYTIVSDRVLRKS